VPPGPPAALPEVSPLSVRWRADAFASRFWVIDQLSRWSEFETYPAYRQDLEQRWKLSKVDERVLSDYADVRRKLSAGPPLGAFDLLPPDGRPPERFAAAFFAADSVAKALDTLGLEGADRRVITTAFAHFDKRLTALLANAKHLEPARQRLEALATRAKMAGYLALMARFYDVTQRIESPLEILVLWAPDENQNATQVGRFMAIPVSARVAEHEPELASWVGVTVHEFGHYFASRVTPEARAQVNRRLLALGLVNRQHSNVVDEATQTALGNILFMRERLAPHFEDANFYAYEPDNDRPDAIDTLARALEGPVREHLSEPGSFASGYLEAVAAAHEKVFPPRPRHFTRVVEVFTDSKPLRNTFKGLFPAISRQITVSSTGLSALQTAPDGVVPRWVVVSRDYAKQHRTDLSGLAVSAVDLEEHMSRDALEACLRVGRRTTGGLDFLALGTDSDALRRLLIRARGNVRLPLWEPLCVGHAVERYWNRVDR